MAAMHAVTNTHRFAYRGWDVSISLHGVPDKGEVHASARLDGAAQQHHAFALEGAYHRGSAALSAVSSQARAYIDRTLQ